MRNTCSDCRWWQPGPPYPDGKENGEGYCHRYPPIRSCDPQLGKYEIFMFPDCVADDWCGEWQPPEVK